MSNDPLRTINTKRTPQSQLATPDQVENNAGGYVFQTPDDALLHRFLTLGTTGGTYYASEQQLTADAAGAVLDYARRDASGMVDRIVEVSTQGRAPKNQPAIFALAAASALGDLAGRRAAFDALPLVARTGTHLFLFAEYRNQFGGWGRGMQRAIGEWYALRPVADEQRQVVKYRQREGWSHRRLMGHIHHRRPVFEADRYQLHEWILGRDADLSELPLVQAFTLAQAATEMGEWRSLVTSGVGLSWEMLPDAALGHPEVWEALIRQGMPMTALLRQLPRLTRLGVFKNTELRGLVTAQLADPARLHRARVHPMSVLVAGRTYVAGHSDRGSSTWVPERHVIDALDAAFYAAYRTVEPANKRTMLAIDVSGSMDSRCAGTPLSCREAAAGMALVMMATEPEAFAVGFSRGFTPLPISPRQRFDDVVRYMADLPFDRTDCAMPMVAAMTQKIEVDTFVILTDNETWWGSIHPYQALQQYRQKMGIDARLVVAAMTPTQFSIANPADPGSLDVSGFDSAVPQLVSDFSGRRL